VLILGEVSAIILAAGKGERMWPLTSTRPKPLLEVLCKPMLQYHLETLADLGIKKAVLVTHSHEDLLKKTSSSIAEKIGMSLSYVRQSEPLGTGHAVREAIEVSGIRGETVIVYSDIFMTPRSLKDAISKALSSPSYSIAGAVVQDASRYGALVSDGSGKLERIIEKSPELSGKEGTVNAGIMKIGAEEIMEELKRTAPSIRGEIELTSALESLAKKSDVDVLKLEGEWIDVGTPWDLLRANELSLRELCRARGAEEEECVIFDEEKIEIEDPVVLRGPIYIKGSAELGPCAHIRGYSVICGENKIGFSVQIKSSVILRGAKVPHLNYVGDSIIGENVNLGAGTITANVRHDGRNVRSMLKGSLVDTGRKKFGSVIGDGARTGINTSILPGVKIGSNAWIGAGCIVNEDVPDGSIVKCGQEKEVRKRRDA
jgi:bifunctional UDP-N-acetylglucosamine pyrophosphorylase/glucosamine-1-phosphate N-acetyltransferase